ncbi:MAG: NfeD family protein, partial [Herbaspirillum sp.]
NLLLLAGGGLLLQGASASEVGVSGLIPAWDGWLAGALGNPSVALLLIMLGIYGLFFELWSPGAIFPGVIGALSLLLGLYAMHALPLNFIGVMLTLLGLGLMLLEVFVSAFGALAIGGVVAFGFGASMLVDTRNGVTGVPLSLIAGIAVFSAVFFLVVARIALRAARRPVVSGGDTLVGSFGEVLGELQTDGWARVQSETWAIHSKVPLHRGERVRVIARHGLLLDVVPDNQLVQGEKS